MHVVSTVSETAPGGSRSRHHARAERAGEQGARFDQLLGEHQQVLSLLDSTAALRGLASRMREICGAQIGLAGPIESDDLLVLRQWNGTRATGLHDLHVPAGIGLGGLASAELQPVWVHDYRSSDLITHDFDGAISADQIKTMLAVPMMRSDRLYGVVYAAMREATELSDRQLDAAVNVARSGALALQTAQDAQRQRESSVAAERRRVAAALHDSVGAQLFRIGSELHDLRTTAGESGEGQQLLNRLVSLENQLAETASAFRESICALEDVAPEGGLAAALSRHCDSFAERTGVSAQAVEVGSVPGCDEHRQRVLVAAVREALLNVEKHARARSVLVSVTGLDGGLTLSVADDGVGWDDRGSGLGMRAMRERVESVGGSASAVTNEDGGLTVRIWVPAS